MSMLFGYTLSHGSSAFNHLWSHLITCLNLNLALLVLASCVGLLCLYQCSRYSFTPDALLMWTDWGLSLSEYIVSVLHLYMILSQPILTAYLRCYARLGLLSRSGWLVWPIPSTFILIGAVLHPLVVLSLGWRQVGGERGLLCYLMQMQFIILVWGCNGKGKLCQQVLNSFSFLWWISTPPACIKYSVRCKHWTD